MSWCRQTRQWKEERVCENCESALVTPRQHPHRTKNQSHHFPSSRALCLLPRLPPHPTTNLMFPFFWMLDELTARASLLPVLLRTHLINPPCSSLEHVCLPASVSCLTACRTFFSKLPSVLVAAYQATTPVHLDFEFLLTTLATLLTLNLVVVLIIPHQPHTLNRRPLLT